jgi:hypothetical protein
MRTDFIIKIIKAKKMNRLPHNCYRKKLKMISMQKKIGDGKKKKKQTENTNSTNSSTIK